MSRLGLVALATVGCMQAAPHAVVQVTPGVRGAGGAILVMPTVCVPDGVMAELCTPATMLMGTGQPVQLVETSYAAYVDPGLRLKLEFAGYTLAEAGAMRLETGERTDVGWVDGAGQGADGSTVTASGTVADLGPEDVNAVARSLGLGGVVSSTFTISPAGFGEIRADLAVTLWDLETGAARWTVRCGEKMYGYEETPRRLASCVGNGVLAALAPENLIGRPL